MLILPRTMIHAIIPNKTIPEVLKSDDESLKYQIALSLVPGIGPVLAKNLVSYCGGVREVFNRSKIQLERIPGIGPERAGMIRHSIIMKRAEEELVFIRKYGIKSLFYLDKAYPQRLSHCVDAPILMYFKGDCDLNAGRFIAVVGTRHATSYGREVTEKTIADLAAFGVTIVSGLAYGIDIIAHRAAMEAGLGTVAVTAHGLDRIYPSLHKCTAEKMTMKGGVLSEYISGTMPDRENFPARNRIVAGMCDATIVVESAQRGGALITADIANSYNRDVFAFPGRIHDAFSQGCLSLVKENKAMLVCSADDIAKALNWDIEGPLKKPEKSVQLNIFTSLSEEEQRILNRLRESKLLHIDELALSLSVPLGKLSSILLRLEFEGLIRALPGKRFEFVS